MTHRRLCLSAILALATILSAGCKGPEEVQPPANTLPAQFQATVYEVQAAPDRMSALDGKALAKRAATAEELLGALSEIGASRILYRFDQPVNLLSETLQLGSHEPIVMGTRTSNTGQAINTVQYQNVGVIIRLSSSTPPKGAEGKAPEVKLSGELAALADSDVEILPGRKVKTTRRLSFEHSEELDYGTPRVMLAVSSTSTDTKQPPAMYVIRYVFHR